MLERSSTSILKSLRFSTVIVWERLLFTQNLAYWEMKGKTRELGKDSNNKGEVCDIIWFHDIQSWWDLMVFVDICRWKWRDPGGGGRLRIKHYLVTQRWWYFRIHFYRFLDTYPYWIERVVESVTKNVCLLSSLPRWRTQAPTSELRKTAGNDERKEELGRKCRLPSLSRSPAWILQRHSATLLPQTQGL